MNQVLVTLAAIPLALEPFEFTNTLIYRIMMTNVMTGYITVLTWRGFLSVSSYQLKPMEYNESLNPHIPPTQKPYKYMVN